MSLIDGINFNELESEKYWSFAKSYKGNPKIDARNMIFSGEYVGARKMDGAYYRFVKDMDGNMGLQGRSRSVSGEFLNKIEWVPQLDGFFSWLPNGTCLLGEIYFPQNEGSNKVTTIMGCLKEKALERQDKGEKLHYYVFDVWAYDGKSYLKTKMEDRVKVLQNLQKFDYVEIAQYCDGEELWNNLQLILANGGEGVVITKKNATPEPGKRTARKTLKIKKEFQETIDCFFTGKGSAPTKVYSGKEIESWKYWVNEITDERLPEKAWYADPACKDEYTPVTKPYYYKWAGSLEIAVLKDGKVHPLGWISGLSDEIKANFKQMKGKCCEVSAMQWTDETMTALRHGKMIQLRPDLNYKDCTWEKVMGE